MFIAPWLCGIVLFFIQPLISLVRYSVTDFQFMQEQGSMFAPLEGGWWENYRTAFQGDALFPQKFTATLLDMLYRVPVILIFSLFVAIVLNQKFKGRGFMRLIFFLPVLVTTGVISSIIKTSLTTVVVGGDSATNIFSAALLTRQLLDAGLPEGLVNTVGGMIANVSDLVWSSGVQILVFLMGLLTIPQSHYEVAQVEGATGWEAFWKVTFPAVSPYILVGLVYSAIDHFIGYDNAVMKYITDNAYNNFRYSYAAAMSWIYFGAILLCLAVLVFITSRFIRYGGRTTLPAGRGGPVMVKNKRASYANADSSPLYYLGRAVWSAVRFFFLLGMTFVILYPLLYMLSMSLRAGADMYDMSVVWLPKHFTLDNFRVVFEQLGFGTAMLNTIEIALGCAVIQVFVCALTGYGFAVFRSRAGGCCSWW